MGGGKVFLFDMSCQTDRHAMFFDDNIRYDDFFIVQPISINEPDRKHWVINLLQTHLCRAEPLESVPNRQYFVRQVAKLEEGYDKKLKARERLSAVPSKQKNV